MARLIDADALKKAILDLDLDNSPYWLVVKAIDDAPAVPNEYMRGYEVAEREYKRPHGIWISKCDVYYDGLICSVCGEFLPCSDEYRYRADYCPNCGAKMEV